MKIRFINKQLIFIFSLLFTFLITNCKKDEKIDEGSIEYKITYPCLEKSNNSLMFLLPKKMIMTFKNNCFKNKFIFSNPNSNLEAISNCNNKEITLAFRYGKSFKFTKLDSNTINILLDDVPNYSNLKNRVDSVFFLNMLSFNHELKSSENDSIFNITSTSEIDIKDVNWCSPFNEIKEVMLEYSLIQYGIEMKFKAEKINLIEVDDEFLSLNPNYKYLPIKQYLNEVKSILSIFSCN